MSQTDLAKAIGLSLRTIQLYEKKNANIPFKNLNKIANYFEMGIDQLYAREVNEVGARYDKSGILSKKGHSISKLAPGKYLLTVPLVTANDQMGYCTHNGDQEFINNLARISFMVDQVSVARYMAFEISNNSMQNGQINGIPQRSIVLGKRVSKKELIKKVPIDAYWIIVHKDTLMCKDIAAYDKHKNTISCHSLNDSPEYPDFDVDIDHVEEFFMILRKQVG